MKATKTWLRPGRLKQCYQCDGVRKIVREAVGDGVVFHTTCGNCGRTEDYQAHKYHQQRPCARCKFVRRVTVSVNDRGEDDHAAKDCDACLLERSAANHLWWAHKLNKKANEIRARRKS